MSSHDRLLSALIPGADHSEVPLRGQMKVPNYFQDLTGSALRVRGSGISHCSFFIWDQSTQKGEWRAREPREPRETKRSCRSRTASTKRGARLDFRIFAKLFSFRVFSCG